MPLCRDARDAQCEHGRRLVAHPRAEPRCLPGSSGSSSVRWTVNADSGSADPDRHHPIAPDAVVVNAHSRRALSASGA
jgi:hypothetical protein